MAPQSQRKGPPSQQASLKNFEAYEKCCPYIHSNGKPCGKVPLHLLANSFKDPKYKEDLIALRKFFLDPRTNLFGSGVDAKADRLAEVSLCRNCNMIGDILDVFKDHILEDLRKDTSSSSSSYSSSARRLPMASSSSSFTTRTTRSNTTSRNSEAETSQHGYKDLLLKYQALEQKHNKIEKTVKAKDQTIDDLNEQTNDHIQDIIHLNQTLKKIQEKLEAVDQEADDLNYKLQISKHETQDLEQQNHSLHQENLALKSQTQQNRTPQAFEQQNHTLRQEVLTLKFQLHQENNTHEHISRGLERVYQTHYIETEKLMEQDSGENYEIMYEGYKAAGRTAIADAQVVLSLAQGWR